MQAIKKNKDWTKSYQFFYLIFGCPTLNFRLFSREQRHAPILITAFIQVSAQSSPGEGGGGELVMRLGPYVRPCTLWGLNQEPSNSFETPNVEKPWVDFSR